MSKQITIIIVAVVLLAGVIFGAQYYPYFKRDKSTASISSPILITDPCAIEYTDPADAIQKKSDGSKICRLNLFNNTPPGASSTPRVTTGANSSSTVSTAPRGLTEFPKDVLRLTDLTELNLAGNSINKLPPEIGKLTNLKVLYLSNNELTELPREIGQLTNLEMLSLFVNKLKTLPPEIAKLKNLKTLGLHGNNFSKQEETKIKQFLPHTNIIF